MRCSCCCKKKGLFESFEEVSVENTLLNLCTDCATLLYGIRTASAENDHRAVDDMKDQLQKRMKKATPSDAFLQWYKKYLNQL